MGTTTATQEASPVRRPRGRPRDPRVEGMVLGATRDLLLERGFGRLTIAAVAESAGVGKGTIYLRWPDKEALVVAALAEVWSPIPDPDTGSLRGDLTSIMGEVTQNFNGKAGKLFTSVMGEMARHRELRTLWLSNVVEPWALVLSAVFARGVDRGEMRSGIDLGMATESLMGPVIGLSAVRGEKITTVQAGVMVDLFMSGVAA